MKKQAALINSLGYPFPGDIVTKIEFHVEGGDPLGNETVTFDTATVFYSGGDSVVSHIDATLPAALLREAGRFEKIPSLALGDPASVWHTWVFVLALGEEGAKDAWRTVRDYAEQQRLLRQWGPPVMLSMSDSMYSSGE